MAEALVFDTTDIAVDYAHLVARTVHLMRASDEPLTLDDLAETAGLSPYHFARVFRAVAGIPPVEFQTALRFECAKALLLTSPASVTEICYEIGYCSLGTFSRRFKQMVGITPAAFRAMPEIVSGMNMQDAITRRSYADRGSVAQVAGSIVAPGLASHVYVGLFPERLPASRPIVGQMLPRPGSFVLPEVPLGRYHLMAAALPAAGDPLAHLLPGEGVQVGGAEPVEIRIGNERMHRTITLRVPMPTDPPVLTALPALLL